MVFRDGTIFKFNSFSSFPCVDLILMMQMMSRWPQSFIFKPSQLEEPFRKEILCLLVPPKAMSLTPILVAWVMCMQMTESISVASNIWVSKLQAWGSTQPARGRHRRVWIFIGRRWIQKAHRSLLHPHFEKITLFFPFYFFHIFANVPSLWIASLPSFYQAMVPHPWND